MFPYARTALTFASTVLVMLIAWFTVSVYGLGQYEPAWGRGGTVQVGWWLSAGVALAALVSSGMGASLAGRERTVSRVAAVITAAGYVGVSYWMLLLLSRFGAPRLLSALWVIVLPGVCTYVLTRVSAGVGSRTA
jgi:hypothetical protein